MIRSHRLPAARVAAMLAAVADTPAAACRGRAKDYALLVDEDGEVPAYVELTGCHRVLDADARFLGRLPDEAAAELSRRA